MNKEEIQDILEELHLVRPEILQPKAKKLFEAIMIIADERDEYKQKIDKAIEYIKVLREKYFRECVWGSNNDLGELLEILKGSN